MVSKVMAHNKQDLARLTFFLMSGKQVFAVLLLLLVKDVALVRLDI